MKKLLLFLIGVTTFLAVSSQTNVGGGIYANTTWTLNGSPYIVVDTITVFPNVTLTIQPGVIVKFRDSLILNVRGHIDARGTVTDSIHFTSASTTPRKKIWQGINLGGVSFGTGDFDYCVFEYAYFAINTSPNWSGSGLISVSHSAFYNNTRGVYGGLNIPFPIVSCSFLNNDIGLHGSDFVVSNSVFLNSTYYGIDGGTSNVSTSFFCGNKTGVRISGNLDSCVFTHNDLGVEYGCYATNNIIVYNNIGARVFNRFGINNVVCKNTTFNLKNVNTNTINAANNCWCDIDSNSIAQSIYDGFDDVSLGLINFTPFLVCDTTAIPPGAMSTCPFDSCNLSINTNITNATCDTCHNGSATATVLYGSAPITYTWNTSPLQTTATATGLAPGSYTICVGDGNGCTACQTIFIDSTNCNNLAVTAQAFNATCSSCTDGSATATVAGGTPPYSYTWYTSPVQTTATATGLPGGTYTVCVSDLGGCAVCDSATVGIGNCSAHFNLYPDTIPHTYTAVNMASGNGALSYVWNWGDGSTDTAAYPNHTYSTAGLYQICLTITDQAGCTNTFCNNFYLMRTTNTMVQVNVVPQIASGIQDTGHKTQDFRIHPNPANDVVIISVDEASPSAEVIITDVTGRKIEAVPLTTNNQQLSTEHLSSGVYFVTVSSSKGSATRKLVISR